MEKSLAAIIDSLDTGMIVAGQDGLITLVNARASAILGPAARGLSGRPLAELFARLAPDAPLQPGDFTDVETALSRAPDAPVFLRLTSKTARLDGKDRRFVCITDVTGFKLAEARYRDFFEHAVEGVFQSTPGGQFLAVNPALARILGYDSPADLIRGLTDLRRQLYVDPTDRDRLLGLLGAHGRVSGLETRFYRKDGAVRWISQAARLVRDASGQPLYIEGFNIDITDKKLSEEALRLSEERFRRTFDQSPIGASMVALDSRFIRVNESFCRITGYSESELTDLSFQDITYPEDLPVNMVMSRRLISGEIDRYELDKRYVHKSGRIVWVHLSAGLVRDGGGRPLYVLPMVQDITDSLATKEALSKSEARYRAVVEDQTELVCRFTPDGELTFVNDAYARYFGLPKEELTGSRFMPGMPDADRVRLRDHLTRLTPDNPVETIEHRIVLGGGEVRWLQRIDRAFFGDLGEIIEFQSVGRDITGRIVSELATKRIFEEKEQLRLNMEAVFRSIPDAIITVDPQMRVIQTNRSAVDICCIAGDILPGIELNINAGQCKRACFEVLRTTLRTRKPVMEYRVECREQSPGKVIVINSSPLIDRENKFAGGVLVIRDITRLADLEKRLSETHGHRGIIGKSKAMRAVYDVLDNLSEVDSTVLITGESGTGKELIAEALHLGGPRCKGPLVKVNCSALSESLLESELFGHVRGAFTGAIRDKVGRFEAAENGTIFLDEIGDISPRIQLNLLRVLERKEYERVGDSRTRRANVRVLAATNVDLKEKIRQGLFREDLYYRLKVMVIDLPPLRERAEDIPLLTEHFTAHFRSAFAKDISRCSEQAMRIFMTYPWPGNVRELKYALEHACILCPGGEIGPGHLPPELTREAIRQPAREAPKIERHGLSREELLEALSRAGGNRARAAKLLGVHRRTLYRNMEKFGVV